MTNVVIPPSPNNYHPYGIACSPDNTLYYASINHLILLKRKNSNGLLDVTVKNLAHSVKITAISCNINWGKPHKRIVTCSEENEIKIWNAELLEEEFCQKLTIRSLLIGVQFSADSRIVGVTEDGTIILWKFNTQEPVDVFNLFSCNTFVNCMALCSHCSWLLSVGLKDGLVVLVDLRKKTILHKFRGDKSSVYSLSWCPAPVNIFPKIHRNRVKNRTEIKLTFESKVKETEKSQTETDQQSTDVSQVKVIETEPTENELKTETVFPENEKTEVNWDTTTGSNQQVPTTTNSKLKKSPKSEDFVTQCNKLKEQMLKNIRTDLKDNLKKSPNSKADENDSKRSPPIKSQQLEYTYVPEKSINNTTDLPHELIDKKLESHLIDCDPVTINTLKVDEKTSKLIENIKVEESQKCTKAQTSNVEFKQQFSELTHNLRKELYDTLEQHFESGSDNDFFNGETENSTKENDSNSPSICSEEPEGVEEEPRNEYLLASLTKDGKIYIWRAGTDSRLQTFWSLPKSMDKKKVPEYWYDLCWVTPNILLSTSRTGDLFQWTLPKPKDFKSQYRLIHKKCHGTYLFNIACAIKISTPYNWCDKYKLHVWTYGYNWVLCEVIFDEDNIDVKSYSTTNPVCSMINSPVDPNRIVLGLRDGSFKLWDLSTSKNDGCELTTYFTKLHNIISMAWHPVQEAIVAFGAEKGRVGYINLTTTKWTLFDYEFESPVYKVDWGPLYGNKDILGLYVTSDRQLVVFNMEKKHDAPYILSISNIFPIYRHCWKPNYDYLLVSTKDQSILVLDTHLKTITTLYLNEKLRSFMWHPNAISNQADCCNTFAVATSTGFFTYDFNPMDEIEGNVPANKKNCYLQQYEEEVKCLAWNSLDLNKIACLTADGLIQIWNVSSKTVLSSCFMPFSYFVWDILWSPINENDIIVAGICITIWNTSEDFSELANEAVAARKSLKAKKSKKTKTVQATDVTKEPVSSNSTSTGSVKRLSKKSFLPPLSSSQHDDPAVIVSVMRKLLNKIENDNENGDISTYLDLNDENSLQFFGSKDDMLNFLTEHQKLWKSKDNYNYVEMLSVWKGDVNKNLKEAIDEKRVTRSLISMAPMVSANLWKKCCEVYAEQLMNNEDYDPIEVAFYYIICHKLDKAVFILCENKKFREALSLIKCRLSDDKDNIIKITDKWAKQCAGDGNYEMAAQCYISIQDYENAAKILSRRGNIEILDFAADLALKADNSNLYDAIMAKSNEIKELGIKEEEEIVTKPDIELPTRYEAIMLKM